MTQRLGNSLITLPRPQDDGTQRNSTNSMSGRRAVNMPKQQGRVAMTPKVSTEQDHFRLSQSKGVMLMSLKISFKQSQIFWE